MKLSHVLLLNVYLLSFQAYAMETLDEKNKIYFVDLTKDEDETRTPKLRLVNKSKRTSNESDANIKPIKKPRSEREQVEFMFPDDILLYFLYFPGTEALGRTSKNLHKLFCHPLLNRRMLINSEAKYWEVLKSRNPSGHYELPAVPSMIVLNGEMPTPNRSRMIYEFFKPVGIERLLMALPNLRSLELTNIEIGNKECSTLAETLSTNTSLTSLTLHNNSIDHESGVVLAEILKTNSTLTLLSLHKDDIDFEGGMDFNRGVPTAHINSHCNEVGAIGGIAFGDALKTNTSLTSLNLWGHKIEENGATAIGNALKTNSSLKFLNLSTNKIGDRGAIAIGDALQTNTSLTSLHLGWNQIGNEGATVIGNAIKINVSLKLLSLGKNNFDFQKDSAIMDALIVNTSLISLDLSQGRASANPMGNEGAKKIINALNTNSTLTSLNLWGHKISDWWKIKINKCLASNQRKNIEQNNIVKLNIKPHKKKGHKLKLSSEQVQTLRAKVKAGEKKVNIAKELGIHPYTINNYLNYYEDDQFLQRDSSLTKKTHFTHGRDNKKVPVSESSMEIKKVSAKKRRFEQVTFDSADTDQRQHKKFCLPDFSQILEYEPITLDVVNALIEKAKMNDTSAQDELMQIYYRGFYPNLLMPEKINFLIWKNQSLENVVEKKSYNNDFYTYFVLSHFEKLGAHFPKLLKKIKKRADQGDIDAQCRLGYMYAEGIGIEKDEKEACRYYKLAADQGNEKAQNNLGLMYAEGSGVEKDEKEACRYYNLAVEQGYERAQNNLGLMYAQGRGVEKDEQEACRYYKLAADQGNSFAQFYLGIRYAKGSGVEKNQQKACRYYKLAADQGHASAQYCLGIRYAKGIGVEKDQQKAFKYYKLAAVQGHERAQLLLGPNVREGTQVQFSYWTAAQKVLPIIPFERK